ncbi:MAG: antitoxin family protein [Candidatus Entotheonellia bacterium]
MSKTVRAIVREGKIELLEHVELPEGANVLVTLLPDEEAAFWRQASQVSLAAIWDNAEDDVYGKLLEE